jgi:hypothetical protein
MKHKQYGFSHLLVLFLVVLLCIGGAGVLVYRRKAEKKSATTATSVSESQDSQNKEDQVVQQKEKEPDSPDTLQNPVEVVSADGRTKFVYGEPAGQNNKTKKRILITLPGHGTTAKDGYEIWKPHLSSLNGGTYAKAVFDWWDGEGEEGSDYYSPSDGIVQIRAFLTEQGYSNEDIVVLHGFSRGSANTFAFIANDQKLGNPVFDAVISNSGQYVIDFPVFASGIQPTSSEYTKYYNGIPWVLVCGGLDRTNGKNVCEAMEDSNDFLKEHKANVLAFLKDPNEGHGVFHQSSLGFPKQAIDLIEAAVN